MTREALAITPSYPINGVGPYQYNSPYTLGALRAFVELEDRLIPLEPGEYVADPLSSNTSGSIALTTPAASTYDGGTLYILRQTDIEQGFAGQSARENGLSAQLDWMTEAIQDTAREVRRSLRSPSAIEPGVVKAGRTVLFDDDLRLIAGPTTGEIEKAAENAQKSLDASAKAARSAASAALFDGPWVKTQSNIETDTSLTITAGEAGYVSVGGYVRTEKEGFSYQRVESGEDRITAGAVKLNILPDGEGRLSSIARGLDGTKDETTAFDALAQRGPIVLGGGTVRLEEYSITDKAVKVQGPGLLKTTTEAKPVVQVWGPHAHVFEDLTLDQPNSSTFGPGLLNDHSLLTLRGAVGARVRNIRGDGTDLGIHVGYGLASADDRRAYRNTVSDVVLTKLVGMGLEIFGSKQGSFTTLKFTGPDGARAEQHGVRLIGFSFAVNEDNFIQATAVRMADGLSCQRYAQNNTAFIAAYDCDVGIEVHGQDQAKTKNQDYELRGVTTAGNSVTVTLEGTDYAATVDGSGGWFVALPVAGFPNYGTFTVTVTETVVAPGSYTLDILYAPMVATGNTFHLDAYDCGRVIYDGGAYNKFYVNASGCAAGIFQQDDGGEVGLSLGNEYVGKVLDGLGRLLDCRGDRAKYDLRLVGRNTTDATFGALVQGDYATGKLDIENCGVGLQVNGANAQLVANVYSCTTAVNIAGANCDVEVYTDGNVLITGAGCTLRGRVGGTITRSGAGADADISGVKGYSAHGQITAATDGNGLLNVNHGLKVVPSVVVGSVSANNGWYTKVTGRTGTTMTFRVWSDDTVVVASTLVTIDWIAKV
ncbi:MAG TPA: hypothetical protein DF966_04305 [Sulfitobacter sp.]|nr:hypothetical protein [Sulfitobacter sp.]|tara:strand:- start:1500 stop:3965 length:2466 start_codon:yes stop_codon:yes gene_type:complete